VLSRLSRRFFRVTCPLLIVLDGDKGWFRLRSGGIKKATEIEVRSGPQNVSYIEITDFKVLDDVKSDIFAGPK
jgi:hypothetical protein